MVALIDISDSIRGAFRYNEKKVESGVADLIMSQNYPMDLDRMTEQHRLNMLLKLALRAPEVTANSIHISLNFAPGENLPREKLKLIAEEYMQAIGFGAQPYLVYQHFDAGHPHLHLVSVKVDAHGKRMDTNFIAVRRSEPARKALEIKYGLVKAQDHEKEFFDIPPLNAKAEYGKVETRRAITGILKNVIAKYNFTSLGELNAILKSYNIAADPGAKCSRLRKYNGLLFHILDAEGNPVGVPIAAGRIYLTPTPTLAHLGDRFVKNKISRTGTRPRVKNLIDLCLKKFPNPSVVDLQNELAKENIRMVIHQNDEGRIFGLTYVDFKDKISYNGNKLGTAYGANAIMQRCTPQQSAPSIKESIDPKIPQASSSLFDKIFDFDFTAADGIFGSEPSSDYSSSSGGGLIEIVTQGELLSHYLPYELRKKKKRRKKRNPDNH